MAQLHHERDEAHWAAISRATQLSARSRRSPGRNGRRRLRLVAALWLIHAGFRLAGPVTVERVVNA